MQIFNSIAEAVIPIRIQSKSAIAAIEIDPVIAEAEKNKVFNIIQSCANLFVISTHQKSFSFR